MSIDATEGLRLSADRRTLSSSSWRSAWLALSVITAAFIVFFWQACVAAVQVWYESRTFNHCFLVIPVAGYLIWERRAELSRLSPAPTFWGLPLVGLGALLWAAAHAIGTLEAQHFAIVFLFQTVLIAVLGVSIYRKFLFPFLLLFFLVPSGEWIVPILQDFTAHFAVIGLRLIGIPVFREGVFISVPTGDFHVAEACAGLRFLIATIAFGVVFCEFAYRSWVRRIAFMVLCLVVPVVANALRALGIVYLAYVSNNEVAVGADHLIYGWVFFTLVTAALVGIGLSFSDTKHVGQGARATVPIQASPSHARPERVIAVAAAALLLVGLLRGAVAWAETPIAGAPQEWALPSKAGSWQVVQSRTRWQPDFKGADERVLRTYSNGRNEVHLFIAFYEHQDQTKKVTNSQNRIEGEDMNIVWRDTAALPVDGAPLPVNAMALLEGRSKHLALSWYWVGNEFTRSTIRAMLLRAKATYLDGRPQAASITIMSEYVLQPDEAKQSIAAFLADFPQLGPILARRVAGRP